MATKKYLTLAGLTEYDALIKAEIAEGVTNITNGSVTVKEAEHADSAEIATSATTAGDAEKLGGQLPSYYAKATDIPTGALADKDIVSESDLDAALAEKVNAASEGNHSHLNKGVLDGITSEKVSAWDSAESNAKAYADEKVANLLNNSTEAVDSVMELAEAMENNADAIEALETVAASKVPTSRKINGKDLSADITLSASDVGADASGSASAVQTSLDEHIADETLHITHEFGSSNSGLVPAPMVSGEESGKLFLRADGSWEEPPVYTHPDSGVVVGTYRSVTVDARGHVTSGSNPTTLSEYGITDAYTKTEVDNKTVVDSALSSTSVNPVQNKVVNDAIVTITNAINANTSSINGHTDRISALETKIGDGFEEITSAEIQALFNN